MVSRRNGESSAEQPRSLSKPASGLDFKYYMVNHGSKALIGNHGDEHRPNGVNTSKMVLKHTATGFIRRHEQALVNDGNQNLREGWAAL